MNIGEDYSLVWNQTKYKMDSFNQFIRYEDENHL